MTVLTAEFTHFKLVIHLSKSQQLALRFVHHFEISCCSGCPRDPSDLIFQVKLLRTTRNFLLSLQLAHLKFNMTFTTKGNKHVLFPAGVVSLVFGEVKHIVHLIRWNLEAVLCHRGTTSHRACCGTIARTVGLVTGSWF